MSNEVKEATKDLHDAVEATAFAKRMFAGQLTKLDFINYLHAQSVIFAELEVSKGVPHESLRRMQKLRQHLASITDDHISIENVPLSAQRYAQHIRSAANESQRNAHIYLNYMALMFGGSMMSKMFPGDGSLYVFENKGDCIKSIRALDIDIATVAEGFLFQIEIMHELEAMSDFKR
jgi:heme oxygenase